MAGSCVLPRFCDPQNDQASSRRSRKILDWADRSPAVSIFMSAGLSTSVLHLLRGFCTKVSLISVTYEPEPFSALVNQGMIPVRTAANVQAWGM